MNIMDMKKVVLLAVVCLICSSACWAQYERRIAKRDFYDYFNNANYDESLVPEYTLPDVMACLDGTKVTDIPSWESKRRQELMDLFTTYMYGRCLFPTSLFRLK